MTASALGSASAIAVACVLFAAAAAKFARPGDTARSFRNLGLRSPHLLSRLVPCAEVAIGALLLGRPVLGGWCAFALLVCFSAALVPVVRSGRRVSCGCFGASSAAPVTVLSLVRNAALALAALSATMTERLGGGLPVPLIAAGALAFGALTLALAEIRMRGRGVRESLLEL